MSVLLWVQTVCKGYQQMTKVATSKDRVTWIHTESGLYESMQITPGLCFICAETLVVKSMDFYYNPP